MEFIRTPQIQSILKQSTACLNAGYPVHFRGPAGTGKTTLALLSAEALGRPLIVLHGNDDYTATDLVGAWTGYSRRKTLDNFIHSVTKSEEEVTPTISRAR